MRKFMGTLFITLIVMFFGGCLFLVSRVSSEIHLDEAKIRKPSILMLKIEGVIVDGKKFLEDLKKYSEDNDIKGVLIQVNSPGGVVGPSQEIYTEIKRVRDELKKPVVVSCLSVAASGAFYAAMGANKIVTNPGTLMGSVGVIMEFANLEKLYDWAKIKRYSINTGAYKDSGAEYREMREDEKLLFQSLANEILAQFKKAVSDARKMPLDKVSQYSDGRVFSGATAVSLGFADQIGTLEDARRLVGQLSGLGEDPEVFEPPQERGQFIVDLLSNAESRFNLGAQVEKLSGLKLIGQPLFIMPGTFLN